ncbi:oligosaccharide flippase family protein [Olleya sp. Ti.3.14]|uniref:oligosaccharide flippase family protein n=1 Tax=Olleya sp. Ti.3.14 TaxID=3121297 RepID=UPI0031205476
MSKLTNIVLGLKQNDFIKDSFWALLGNVIAKGMSLLGAILVARFLQKDLYGEYGTIKSTLTNLAIFSTLGLGYTATKYIAQYKNEKPELLNTITKFSMKISFVVSTVLAIALLLFANYIASDVLEAPHLTTPLRFVSVWIVFNALTTAQIGILSGFNAFKPMARISTYVGVFAFITSVIFTYVWSLNGALLALLSTQILNWLLNYIEVQKYLPKNQEFVKDKTFLKQIIQFSIPVALQEGLYALTSWLMILMLLKLSDFGQVGLYSAAIQWSVILLFIPGILRNVILTHLSGVSNNQNEHKKILKQTLTINFLATFIPFLIIYFLRGFVTSFYGESYGKDLESVLTISLLAVVFISLSNVYTQAYMSLGKNWLMLVMRLFRDCGIIGFAYVLIIQNYYTGAIALVMSTVIIQVLFLICISFVFHKVLRPNIKARLI